GMGFAAPGEGYLTATDMWYPTLDYDGQVLFTTEVDFPDKLTALAAGKAVREAREKGRYTAKWVLPVRHGHNSLCYGTFVSDSKDNVSVYLQKDDQDMAPKLLAESIRIMAFYEKKFAKSKYENLKICQIQSPFFKGYAEATLVMLGG